MYTTLDHFCKSESPSFDSLNEKFYDSDKIPKKFSKLDKLVQLFGKKP